MPPDQDLEQHPFRVGVTPIYTIWSNSSSSQPTLFAMKPRRRWGENPSLTIDYQFTPINPHPAPPAALQVALDLGQHLWGEEPGPTSRNFMNAGRASLAILTASLALRKLSM